MVHVLLIAYSLFNYYVILNIVTEMFCKYRNILFIYVIVNIEI